VSPMGYVKIKSGSEEVARRAGVSRTTVSYVLNGRRDVSISATTRDRVLAVAREMGYQPNPAARALVTGRTGLIAFMASRLYTPSAAEVLHRVQEQVEGGGLNLIIVSSFARFDPRSVDGIIAFDSPAEVAAFLGENPNLETPFVSMGPFHHEGVDHVGVDLYDGARAALRHLLETGARRIAHVAEIVGIPPDESRDPRTVAYREAMAEAGLATEYVIVSEAGRAAAREAIREYVARHGCPDALFCRADLPAVGAYRGLRDLGIRVPDQVAIVGCNGIEETRYLEVPLSTIVQPFEEMCAASWRFLRSRMANPGLPRQSAVLQPVLEIRESSRK
jgi:DNA-binding LacI/PurR family transcriptional regulator